MEVVRGLYASPKTLMEKAQDPVEHGFLSLRQYVLLAIGTGQHFRAPEIEASADGQERLVLKRPCRLWGSVLFDVFQAFSARGRQAPGLGG